MSTATDTPAARISETKILRGGLVVGAGLATGQVLGFVRQATIAYLLGTGPHADAIAVAFAPVDYCWAVLATTVLFGFGPLLAAGPQAQGPSFVELRRWVLGVALLLTAAFQVFAPQIVRMLAPGLPEATAQAAADLLRITCLALPAVACSMLYTALLYSERKFVFPAFHHSVVNLATILTAVMLAPAHSALGLAMGYAAGAWLQLGGASIVVRRGVGVRYASTTAVGWRALLAGPAPVLCYAALIGMTPMVTRALVSTFGPGSTAAFDYCLRLVGVPLALLVVPLSASLLSEIAPFRLRQDRRAALAAIGRAAGVTALAAAAIVAAMEILGPRVVELLFERGQFSDASTATVSAILAGFFPVLAAWSVLDLASRSFFALGRPRVPIAAAALALAVNAAISTLTPPASLRWAGMGAVLGFLSAALLMAVFLVWIRRPYGTDAAP